MPLLTLPEDSNDKSNYKPQTTNPFALFLGGLWPGF